MKPNLNSKISWQGKLQSIQPRTRIWRYVTDNRTHYHLGYNLFLKSDIGDEFCVAISEKQQQKFLFRIGDSIQGEAWTKKYKEREYADFYRAGSLKLLNRENEKIKSLPPPWIMLPPSMKTYEERGARMLSQEKWKSKCFTCIWANMANVEIQWDFDKNIKRYRFETFCYGPISCSNYSMGKPRSVPYKGKPSVLDDGCLDDLCISCRDDDELVEFREQETN
ncbi:MAG: hypothetical protein ACD_79C00245G0001 [uncultured bacterium]|nr:MAG: hypothetical protein ACD_79C00245G0001 [uncultured bacterium]